jgi:serine/threonine-protein kinase
LDKYKTQVLLLHSEQSTLDDLSSGFNDRYTVHCATSGSEALNTLVETPINVIITAHDLPGMSGLDALREAKKRSPDTIGILLAGTKTTDIQALVGDEEVFQVVSGTITGDGLLKLVDNATRQIRLMALAESANDTTAGVDESAEHIIMETSENGSTIISDGTGRMPVLDPKKVSAAVNVGSRSVDVLVLTKDQEFFETIKDSSRGMHKVYYANTLGQANEAIREHKIGVAVVDAAMVGEKIEQLTQYLRKGSPRLVSIVAGRRDDGEMLMDLINRGKVYRFLLKPVSPGRARLAVEASVKHHLEAPDAAFKAKGVPAATKPVAARAAPKRAARPEPKAVPEPSPEPVAKVMAASAPAAKVKQIESPAPAAVDPPLGSAAGPAGRSPIEDGLADAFGGDDSSFTETVTGLISSVSNRFSSDRKPTPAAPDTGVVEKPSVEKSHSIPSALGTNSGRLLLRNPKIMGIGAAALVIAAGTLFWFMNGSEEPVAQPEEELGTPSFAEADVNFEAQPPAAEISNVRALMDEARLARDAGQVFSPAGDNAIELFAAALDADPDNSLIAIELDAVVTQALTLAETAMLDARLDDTDAALQSVATVDPQNVRLPFLTAQLSQMQLRARLDEARAAIREDRFEDAGTALSAARGLSIADTTEIDAVDAELSAARSEQQVDDVMAKAAARLDAGNLLSPSNDNARYYYELVLSNDAGNTAARQGLSVIAGKLAFQARTETDNGDLRLASDTLANAHALDPANSEVAAASAALENRRAAIAEQERLDEADRQARTEQQATAERQAEADRLAAERQTEIAMAAKEQDVIAGETDAPSRDTELAAIYQQPAAVSSLNRTKYVAPKYPRTAQRRNLSGWVDVVFTVATDGTVTDIGVRNSEPGDTFVNSALKAVEKWEFEPVVVNGVFVEKRAGVRMMFALE